MGTERERGRWFTVDQMLREGFSKEVTLGRDQRELRESLLVLSEGDPSGRGSSKG